MKLVRTALIGASAFSLAACATTGQLAGADAASDQVAASATSQDAAHDALFALFEDADERSLALNPMSALFRGDMRYADRLGDYLTDEYNNASRADAELNLRKLGQIDRSALNETDQLAYDVFEYDQRQALKALAPDLLAVTEVRPVCWVKPILNCVSVTRKSA